MRQLIAAAASLVNTLLIIGGKDAAYKRSGLSLRVPIRDDF
ncbi:MAG TPA: hypothetical protein PK695_07910 [Chitinophagaceae bacterium]|nr:MAG: hypothetical protein BWZ05_00328 [Bacteroidetes bacterium ADurb.BinA245]HMW66427.1 hypothetical protein [Chitinophagaceae bacterium]HMX78373.1 hypothetical protein [Chitinophagaceae bacterium]HNA18301.1 hypothetical protein [Chitinophagaceae bacterium]HNA92148.1 hypothetical protein [Chitinophagaceae bacterium]